MPMPGWHELASYRPWWAFLSGTLTVVTFWGVGRVVGGSWLRSVPEFVRVPAELLAGVLTVSLVVQGFAMAHVSRSPVMSAVWYLDLLAAAVALAPPLVAMARGGPQGRRLNPKAGWWAPAAVLAVALLISAAAPESRADEVSYHALAVARVLTDGGLEFYSLPWEASVLPQLVWHYSLVPLYAVAGSAAGGVASAWLGIALAFAVGRLILRSTCSDALAAAASLVTLSGGYPFVFFSTTGPHAFSNLAGFTAVAAVGWSRELRAAAGVESYAAVVAIGCAGALAGKVTMLPVVGIITLIAWRDVFAQTPDARRRTIAIALLLLIPLAVVGPLTAWTWWASGSPLGAVTAKLTHATAIDAEALAALDGTRRMFADQFHWRFEAAYWSLPLAAGALAALWLESDRARRLRWWLIAAAQALVILLLLPKELRHLGGIQYPLFASGLVAVRERLKRRLHFGSGFDARLAVGVNIVAAPWVLFAVWLTTIYLPVDLGQMGPASFLRHYSGLQGDYEALDAILPADATLLIGRSRSHLLQYAWYARPPVYYAPRPVLFDTAQVHGQRHLYLMYVDVPPLEAPAVLGKDLWLPAGYALGPLVYSDTHARFYPSRTPSGADGLAALELFQLVPPRI
ncbi:MAG: hypothetical protein KGO22_19620 [Gammaproteobacteria bacterium]|nr:hypothetical protein [Gammaproteobacteria bacterium]